MIHREYKGKKILVLNPISRVGHFDSWNAMTVRCLIRSGWRVWVVTPDVEYLKALLPPDILRSPALKISQLGSKSLTFYIRHPESIWQDIKDISRPLRHKLGIRRRIWQDIKDILRPPRHKFVIQQNRKNTTQEQQVQGVSPISLAFQIRAVLGFFSSPPDLVLNLYLDYYAKDLCSWQKYQDITKLKFAGVRMAPRGVPDEGWNYIQLHKGTLYLDQQVCKKHQKLLPRKFFGYLPDVADCSLPASIHPITAEILKNAARRRIVFLGGAIRAEKNLTRWFDLISLADPRHWYFVQIGRINLHSLTPEERVQQEKLKASPPSNLFLFDQYLPGESVFNQIISISHTIFAVYRNFRTSSNMLAKAAAFSVPILVSNRYLIGRLVKKYRIGRAVNEDDTKAIYGGLLALKKRPPSKKNYEKFNKHYSEERFGAALSEFLARCCE